MSVSEPVIGPGMCDCCILLYCISVYFVCVYVCNACVCVWSLWLSMFCGWWPMVMNETGGVCVLCMSFLLYACCTFEGT